MNSTNGEIFHKEKCKRPDSLKVELLTIPENGYVRTFDSSVRVGFKNISLSVTQGLIKRKNKVVLDQINGEFSSGELTAIMGPSGSGKSTLMNILAGYTSSGLSGQRLINDEIRDESSYRKQSCYIMQDDHLQPLLTVQEAMSIAANLKLSSKLSSCEKELKIKEILDSMGLWQHKNVRTSSLSGGQKKRLSIALELLKNPQVLFLDEPTSGLDSLTSKQCVMLLKDLASSGRTIICTIHQPSAMIFEMFDHLYVLAAGKCLYQGSIKGLLPYLERFHLRCPTYHNPADFLLEVASGEHGDYIEILSTASENGLNTDWKKKTRDSFQLNSIEHVDKLMNSGRITPVHAPKITFPKSVKNCDKNAKNNKLDVDCCGKTQAYPTSIFNQILVLLKRACIILSRDRTLTFSRIGTHAGIALFIGILYFGIGKDASKMMNNFNFMFFSVMFLMLTSFNCITTTFPYEMPIITREHFNKWYSLKSYYLAVSISDIPVQMVATLLYAFITYFMTMQPMETFRFLYFLFMCILISLVAQSFGLFIGACMDIKNGVIFGPFCFLPFTIFSGFFVQLNDAHPHMRWLFHISFLKYGLEGMVLSVFGYERPKLPCEDAPYCHYVYPYKFLKEMDMENAQYWRGVIFLLGLFIVIRFAAYFALSIQIKRNRIGRR